MKRWLLIVLIAVIGYQHYRILSLESDVHLLAKGVKIALRHELRAVKRDRRIMQSVDGLYGALLPVHEVIR